MPRPPSSTRAGTGSTQKIFVNREGPIARFRAALDALTPDSSDLLVFHGLGGQGKTALCHELARLAADPQRPKLAVSTLDLHTRRDINPALALLWVRNALAAGSKKSFAAFDIGYAMFWHACYPEMPLPDFGTAGWLAYLDDAAPDALADGAQSAIEEISGGLLESLPFGALIRRGIGRGIAAAKLRWTYRRNPILRELADAAGNPLPPTEIERRLPDLLAWDIGVHASGGQRFVVFIDEYERVLEQGGATSTLRLNLFDDAIRQLVARARGTLFVVCSREMLPWADRPTADIASDEWAAWIHQAHHQLGGLKPADAERFLNLVPIREAHIRAAMIEGSSVGGADNRSDVYPLMLDLQVSHYASLRQNAGYVPAAEDFRIRAASFAALRKQMLQRLLRDYGPQTEGLLKRLAVARRFDRRLVMFLEKELPSGFPLTDFASIANLSFVEEGPAAGPDYVFHRIVREGLLEFNSNEDIRDTHEALFRFHAKDAQIANVPAVTQDHVDALAEASYHKLQYDAGGLLEWWTQASQAFRKRLVLQPVLEIQEWLYEQLDPLPATSDELRKELLGEHIDTLLEASRLPAAIDTVNRLIPILRRMGATAVSDLAQRLLLSSALYSRENRLLEAELAAEDGYDLLGQIEGAEALDVRMNYNLTVGLAFERQGLFDQSIEARRTGIELETQKYGNAGHKEVLRSRMILANVLASLGRFEETRTQIAEVLRHIDDPSVDEAIAIQMLVDAAELYDRMGSQDDRRACISRAAAIYAKLPPEDDRRTDRRLLAAVVGSEQLAGNSAGARAALEHAIALVRARPGHVNAELAALLLDLTRSWLEQGDATSASACFNEAHELIEKDASASRELVTELLITKLVLRSVQLSIGPEWLSTGTEKLSPEQIAIGMELPPLISAICHNGGRASVIQFMRAQREQAIAATSPDHPSVHLGSGALAMQLFEIGAHAEAAPLLLSAYEAMKRRFGADSPHRIAALTTSIASLRALGQVEQTQPLLEDLQQFTDLFEAGEQAPLEYYAAKASQAEHAILSGEHERGIALCDEVLERLEREHGKDNSAWPALFMNRALLRTLAGRPQTAELASAAAICRRTVGLASQNTAMMHTFLADALIGEGRLEDALDARWIQVQCLHLLVGSRAVGTRLAMTRLAAQNRDIGRCVEAKRWFRKALRDLAIDSADAADGWCNIAHALGLVLSYCGDFAEALELNLRIVNMPPELFPANHALRDAAALGVAAARIISDVETAQSEVAALLQRPYSPELTWIRVLAWHLRAIIEARTVSIPAGLAHLDTADALAEQGPPQQRWTADIVQITRERLRATAGVEGFDLAALQGTFERHAAACGRNLAASNGRRLEVAETLVRRGYVDQGAATLETAIAIYRDCCGGPGGHAVRINAIQDLIRSFPSAPHP